MSGDSSVKFTVLHRTCKLVVLLCFLHISVTLVFYLRSLDTHTAFSQHQQSHRHNVNFTTAKILEEIHFSAPDAVELTEVSDVDDVAYVTKATKILGKCPKTSPLLVGPLRIEFSTPVSLDEVLRVNPNIRVGGRFKPRGCIARQKVALIIPFRKRDEHLKFWLYYLHPILQRQQLDYGVYVINQDGDGVFNRAKLLNIGYVEAMKEYDYECFVFSDVDLIPMDDRNIYKCFNQPRHLSVSMDKFGFRLPYNQYFGGVSSMSKEQYLTINGFPNNYWGWGGEDDDIFNRLHIKGMSISRPSGPVGKCRMIRHERDKQNADNPQRFDRITHTRDTIYQDGINTLSYSVVKIEKEPLFTKITVDVGIPPK